MAKDIKKEAQLKSRQTKLMKKSHDELVDIVLRKDKTERNLNNQIVNLKSEINALSTRVNNFDKDMEGTMQSLDTYKDQVKALQEKNDTMASDYKDARALFNQENRRAIALEDKLGTWKVATYIMTAIAIIAIFVAII